MVKTLLSNETGLYWIKMQFQWAYFSFQESKPSQSKWNIIRKLLNIATFSIGVFFNYVDDDCLIPYLMIKVSPD